MAVKLIADGKTRKVLGLQAVVKGDVAKRIDVVVALLTLGGTIDDLFDVDLSYAPPFNSPIHDVAVAAHALMNKIQGIFKEISAFDAKDMMVNKKAIFLHVRTPNEYKEVKLAEGDNIKHITLGELRNRCTELIKDDEIIAFCKFSLRGYDA